MLGQKSVEQELSQSGLNTTGIVNSAYSNLENSYGNNLANLQTSRDKSITDINRQLNDTNLQYSIKQSELLSDIEKAKLELQKYGNELAYQKYQDALNNYMTFTNYDYQKSLNDRDYNYKIDRDKVSDNQWQKEYELALKQLELSKKNSMGSSSRSSSGSRSFSSNGSSGNKEFSNKTSISADSTKSYQDVLNNMKIVQGAGITKPIKDGYTGKTFASAEELLAYYGYKASK